MDKQGRETLAARVLNVANGALAEAIVTDQEAGLTRFTHDAIHQNVESRNTTVRVRTVSNGRTGVAETNVLGDDALSAVVARAAEMAALAPSDASFAGLSRGGGVASPPGAYAAATANASPALRAELAAETIAQGAGHGLWAAGFVRTSRTGITVANTNGTLVSFDGTECGLSVKQNGADASGFAEAYATDVAALDAAAVGKIAVDKARHSAAPREATPGAWTVILEPPAFGELLSYLSDHFSAQAFDEGSSFLSSGLERAYCAEAVTLTDDFAHPLQAGMPFDFEGNATQRVPLLERGVARNVVTDANWARRLGRPNTGHGLPAPSGDGPRARHLVVSGGDKTLDRLIAETTRGLLVSRFWYVRPVDHRKTIVTGMTRDGTFLIENGSIVAGVRNLRFNQSILDALRNAEFGDRQARTSGYAYASVVPAVKIDGFHFTSAADF